MRKPRLALCGDGRSPHTKRWANAMADRGFDVTVVWRCDQFSPGELAAYESVVRHASVGRLLDPRRPWRELHEIRRAAAFARQLRPDVVHGLYLEYHGWTAHDFGVHPLVLSALGSDVLALGGAQNQSRRARLVDAYRRLRTKRALRACDVVLADSSRVIERVEVLAPSVRTELVRFGAEPPAPDDGGWRDRLGLSRHAMVVLSTRLLKENYNIDVIIEAMAGVVHQLPEAVLVLKEFESFSDSEYRARCLALVESLGIQRSVRFVGELEPSDLSALYAAADIYVTVPSTDATAVSVFEAMAARAPVVASRAEGIDSAVLRDGETALLVEPRDADGLRDAIVRVARDADLRGRLAEAGFAMYEVYGRSSAEFDRVADIYRGLIG